MKSYYGNQENNVRNVVFFFVMFAMLLTICWKFVGISILSVLFNSAIIGGILSGSLHALTGSDHLAALLPLIFGKRWWQGCFYGCIWGLGHGLTSGAIGLFSYTLKSYFVKTTQLFEQFGYVIDAIVGITLVVIGIMGMYEASHDESNDSNSGDKELALSDSQLSSESDHTNLESRCLDVEANPQPIPSPKPSSLMRSVFAAATVFANGCILGVSWDGLPSLAPAVLLEHWALYSFLVGYIVGTFATMAFAAGLVSETTCWINRIAKVNVSERLASVSSLCAIAIGTLWVFSGVLKGVHMYMHLPGEGSTLSMHDLNDGSSGLTADSLSLSEGVVSMSMSMSNDNADIGNDTFHEHVLGAGWSLFLGAGSVVAVAGVVVYTTQVELGGFITSSFTGKPAHIHQV